MKSSTLLLSVLVAACFAFAGCDPENGEGVTPGGRDGSSTWRLKDGILTIKGGMRNYTFDDHAPWQPYYLSIKEVVIVEGVPFIGTHAFEDCIYIEKVSIPASLQEVGRCAFLNCHALTSFEIAAGNAIFSSDNGALLASDGGQTIFVAYPSVSGSYTIPDGVDGIADWAFACCPHLTGITIPGTVESIGDSAFWTCESLESITIGDGVKTIGDNAFDARSPHITSLVIPDSVESIGFGAMAVGPNMVSLNYFGYCDRL